MKFFAFRYCRAYNGFGLVWRALFNLESFFFESFSDYSLWCPNTILCFGCTGKLRSECNADI